MSIMRDSRANHVSTRANRVCIHACKSDSQGGGGRNRGSVGTPIPTVPRTIPKNIAGFARCGQNTLWLHIWGLVSLVHGVSKT